MDRLTYLHMMVNEENSIEEEVKKKGRWRKDRKQDERVVMPAEMEEEEEKVRRT